MADVASAVVNTLLDEADTPHLLSPPESKTPPTVAHKRHHDVQEFSRQRSQSTEAAVDSRALTKALEQYAQAAKQREHTPAPSPARKRQRMMYGGDRFIPNRGSQDLSAGFNLLEGHAPPTPSRARSSNGELNFQRIDEANRTYTSLLRSELFDDRIPRSKDGTRSTSPPTGTSMQPPSLAPATPRKNFLNFTSPRDSSLSGHPTPISSSVRRRLNFDPTSDMYSLTPIRYSSQKMLLSPRKQSRSVSKVPYKVLDAPDLADDFYLNLVDWGSSNILGVGLGSCVYMWNSSSGRVTKLCELQDDTVTSVNWIQRGSHIAVGTGKGFVQIWDATSQRRLRTMTGHTARVGALAWNEHILTSGARDRLIYHRDVRQPDQWLRKLVGHKQEVCGLKWNCEDGQLASGGNDNKLMIWDKMGAEPLYKFGEHNAAVKAIAWSPHQRGLLASGGGTADRTIKFWNTLTSSQAPSSLSANAAAMLSMDPDAYVPPSNLISSLDTGSQVCNLAWSRNSNELVSTHGYSQNQIVVWKYPSMQQVVSLTGHTYRVLYLAMSPDGDVIVTGAGDETLRFWEAFKKKEKPTGMGTTESWGVIR